VLAVLLCNPKSGYKKNDQAQPGTAIMDEVGKTGVFITDRAIAIPVMAKPEAENYPQPAE
jgi:hypothetical protein